MPDLGESLSPRELEVLEAMARGASNRDIAEQLVISPNTVKAHVRNVATKLGVSSRTEAVTVALQRGIIAIGRSDALEIAEEDEPPAAENFLPAEAAPRTTLVPEPAPAVPAPAIRRRRPPFALWLGAALVVLAVWGSYRLGQRGEGAPGPTAQAIAATPVQLQPLGETGWSIWEALPEPRAGMAVTTIGLNLYAIGGETAEGVSPTTLVYTSGQAGWRTAASKPTAVADAGAAVLAEQIYVAGGRGADGRPTAAFEAYSPGNNAWRAVAALPRPLSGAAVAANGGYLYLIGGEAATGAAAEVYRYDPAADGWRPLPPLREARAYAAVGVIGNTLFVVGGRNETGELASCEQLATAEARWSACRDMLAPRAGATAAALFNRLYVVGGGPAEPAPYGELYDLNTDTWQILNLPMLEAGQSWNRLGVGAIETRLYLLGGVQNGRLAAAGYVYDPFPYQFFFPSTTLGGEP